jgi:hypothetical protein
MHVFFTVDYEYKPESDNCYIATVELWIQADSEERLPKGCINPRVSLMGEKLTPTWGERRIHEDNNLVYRVGKMILASDLNWELLYMRVENLLKISTYVLDKVYKDNLLRERETPGGIVREIFNDDVPY